ncbi:MAG TPA: tRNA(His) guanylyltransferase Thg1 family protein, partial [Polyangiaceae bacterium]
PFEVYLMAAMDNAAQSVCGALQTAQFAYVQSDEISVLLHGYKRLQSQPAFNNRIQKLCSVAASAATASMAQFAIAAGLKPPMFDGRVFALPEAEVANYFLWRQQDATRNSIQMLARSLWSHRECNGANQSILQEMCFQKGHNWNDLATQLKRGRCVVRELYDGPEGSKRSRWAVDNEIPVWTGEGRAYVERHLALENEP